MKKKILVIVLLVGVILLNIALDQVSKIIARHELEGQGTMNIVGEIFIMTYVENDGAFLGMGGDLPEPLKSILLTIGPLIVLIIMAGMIFIDKDAVLFNGLIKKVDFTIAERIVMACIIGGGVSNIMERLVSGKVADFLNFGIPPVDWLRTGILNVADLSIFFGAVVFLILLSIKEQKIKKQKQQEHAVQPAKPE
ncbi:MAG: signal peptidase II [Spirochaetales bacterium]|nr:signal peptidase II [Spirochaetales bacterium]